MVAPCGEGPVLPGGGKSTQRLQGAVPSWSCSLSLLTLSHAQPFSPGSWALLSLFGEAGGAKPPP